MFITRIIGGIAKRHRRHKTTLFLASLSDSQLKDIGISRFDLFDPKWSR